MMVELFKLMAELFKLMADRRCSSSNSHLFVRCCSKVFCKSSFSFRFILALDTLRAPDVGVCCDSREASAKGGGGVKDGTAAVEVDAVGVNVVVATAADEEITVGGEKIFTVDAVRRA